MVNNICRGPASLENYFSKTICHLPAISLRSEGQAVCIWRCNLCINDKRMLKLFIVETPGAAIDTRHGKQSATVRKKNDICRHHSSEICHDENKDRCV